MGALCDKPSNQVVYFKKLFVDDQLSQNAAESYLRRYSCDETIARMAAPAPPNTPTDIFNPKLQEMPVQSAEQLLLAQETQPKLIPELNLITEQIGDAKIPERLELAAKEYCVDCCDKEADALQPSSKKTLLKYQSSGFGGSTADKTRRLVSKMQQHCPCKLHEYNDEILDRRIEEYPGERQLAQRDLPLILDTDGQSEEVQETVRPESGRQEEHLCARELSTPELKLGFLKESKALIKPKPSCKQVCIYSFENLLGRLPHDQNSKYPRTYGGLKPVIEVIEDDADHCVSKRKHLRLGKMRTKSAEYLMEVGNRKQKKKGKVSKKVKKQRRDPMGKSKGKSTGQTSKPITPPQICRQD